MEYTIKLIGGITGSTWWPIGCQCGLDINVNLAHEAERFTDKPTLRDLIQRVLMERGGDFQSAELTADTILEVTAYGNRRRHLRVWDITAFPSIADYVNRDVYSCDFNNED